MDKKELIDFLEEFRTGLISKATDGTIDEAVYSANRDKLINIKEIKDSIPIFIKTQRSAELLENTCKGMNTIKKDEKKLMKLLIE